MNANEVGRRPLLRLISVARLGLETANPPGAAAANVPAHPDAGVGTVAVGAGVEDDARVTEVARVTDDVRDADPPPQADKASASASTAWKYRNSRTSLDDRSSHTRPPAVGSLHPPG